MRNMGKAKHYLIYHCEVKRFLERKGNTSPTLDDFIEGYWDYGKHLRDEHYKRACHEDVDFLPYNFQTPSLYAASCGGSSYDFNHLPDNVVGEMYQFADNEDRAIREEIVLKNGALGEFDGIIESKKYRYGE